MSGIGLTWLVKVRILILMVLLVHRTGRPSALLRARCPSCPFLPGWCCGSCFRCFSFFWFRSGANTRLQAILQVLSDLAMVTLVVHLTGGIDSSLNSSIPWSSVVACMLLPRGWGYLSAALAFILFGSILELDYYLIIPSYSNSHPKLKALQVVIFVKPGCLLRYRLPGRLAMTKLRQGMYN